MFNKLIQLPDMCREADLYNSIMLGKRIVVNPVLGVIVVLS